MIAMWAFVLGTAGDAASEAVVQAVDGGWLSKLSSGDKALLFGGLVLIGFGVLVGPVTRRLRGHKKSSREEEMDALIARLKGGTNVSRPAAAARKENTAPLRLASTPNATSGSADAIRQIEEAALRCLERIDASARRLESLLVEADHRLGASGMDRADHQTRPASARPSAPPRAQREPLETGAHPISRERRIVLEPATGVDPLNERILELAGEGRSPVEIAQALNEHLGKVELILALHAR